LFPSAINGYKIIKKIGSGGGGEVWFAEKNGKKFAIKIPKIDIQQTISSDEIDNFLKKAELWSKLNHPNIVKVYEFGARPAPFVVMEYCESNLRGIINKLTYEEIITIAIKIADALNYAHNHGVVHRDLKPENILICGKEPKIGDWGIAKILLDVTTKTSYTGTPLYSAPEQLDPDKFGEVDWRTDIWQFGCVLYEMFEKKPPFYSNYLGQLTTKILTEAPAEPKNVSSKLKKIILKCLEKRKEKRWPSIGAILERLKEYRDRKTLEEQRENKKLYNKEIASESIITSFEETDLLESIKAFKMFLEGQKLIRLKRYEEAIEYFDQSLALDPNNADVWYSKGTVLYELKQYEEAINCLDRSLTLDPNNDNAWYYKGAILYELGRYEEAINCFDQLLALNPNDAVAWHYKGAALYELKRYKDAVECFDRALAINPNLTSAKKYRRYVLDHINKKRRR